MERNPQAIKISNEILSKIAMFTTLEKNYPFVECATFADEAKTKGFHQTSNWHFTSHPFFDDGFYKIVPPDPDSTMWITVRIHLANLYLTRI